MWFEEYKSALQQNPHFPKYHYRFAYVSTNYALEPPCVGIWQITTSHEWNLNYVTGNKYDQKHNTISQKNQDGACNGALIYPSGVVDICAVVLSVCHLWLLCEDCAYLNREVTHCHHLWRYAWLWPYIGRNMLFERPEKKEEYDRQQPQSFQSSTNMSSLLELNISWEVLYYSFMLHSIIFIIFLPSIQYTCIYTTG